MSAAILRALSLVSSLAADRLTEAEVIEAEEELKALQRHAFAIVDPEIE
jgi:hypothetical protein